MFLHFCLIRRSIDVTLNVTLLSVLIFGYLRNVCYLNLVLWWSSHNHVMNSGVLWREFSCTTCTTNSCTTRVRTRVLRIYVHFRELSRKVKENRTYFTSFVIVTVVHFRKASLSSSNNITFYTALLSQNLQRFLLASENFSQHHSVIKVLANVIYSNSCFNDFQLRYVKCCNLK